MSDAAATTRRRLRVGVLFGGRSGEHEVSLESARAVMDSLARAGHEVVPIGITRAGRWLVSGDPMRALSSGEIGTALPATMLPEPGRAGLVPLGQDRRPDLVGDRGAFALDVVFPVLHGTYGEDGTVQGLLELADVPYVGSGVLGSALGMDKLKQKQVCRGLGLPVVDWVATTRQQIERELSLVVDRVEQALGYPCFTKPANLGSSVGVSKARDRQGLEAGLQAAALYDTRVLVERGVDARELECSMLGTEEHAEASVVGEIVPHGDFYTYRAKYLDSGSQAIIPAEIPPSTSDEVRRLAIEAFRAVDAFGLARVDFFLERGTDRVYLNEVNTMPGFTRISMYPKLWEASGLPFPDLVDRLVQLAIERHAEKARSRTSFNVAEAV